MTLPGFTAARSLSHGGRTYAGSARYAKAERSQITPHLPVQGGTGGSGSDCVSQYQNCYVGCSVQYPESQDSPSNLNALMRQGCYDSCDASYDLCRIFGRGLSWGVFAF